MATDHDLLAKAQAQLALVEQSADDLLRDVSTLGGPAATIAAQRGAEAIERFQATVKLLDPLLAQISHPESSDQRPSQAALDVLWRQAGVNLGQQQQQSTLQAAPLTAPPPSTSIADLLETLVRLLPVTIQLVGSDVDAPPPIPEQTLHLHIIFSVFEARITLRELGSVYPVRVLVDGTSENLEDARKLRQSSGRAILWDRLTTAASEAMQKYNQRSIENSWGGDDQHDASQGGRASPLELLIVWLAASAAFLASPKAKSQEFLVVDPFSGTLVPSFPDRLNCSHAELWAAAQGNWRN